MLLRVCVSVSEKDCKVRKRERETRKKGREGNILHVLATTFVVVTP